MGLARRIAVGIAGARCEVPAVLVERHPQLAGIRIRRGGILPRASGWLIGRPGVAAVTLWRTVWLAAREPASEDLLLHEFCHVTQFQADRLFPFRYVVETLRRGYGANRFEQAARAYARAAVRAEPPVLPTEDV
jgi:hypothetical protein